MPEFFSLFIFIFFTALPGRTTFILVVLAAQGDFWRIFAGAGLAFLIQCVISVLAGEMLGYLPQSYIEIGAGLLFLFFARKFWMEASQPIGAFTSNISHSIKAVFALVFMGELGDVSQLAIAAAASRSSSKGLVLLVAIVAMWLITILALTLGKRLSVFVSPKRLQKVASFVFLAGGLYLCIHGVSSLQSITSLHR